MRLNQSIESIRDTAATAISVNLSMVTLQENETMKRLAANPEAGNVIPGSGGCRKVRWSSTGSGKRGGARVIYFNRLAIGEIWLLVMYSKSVTGNIPPHILKSIREALEHE